MGTAPASTDGHAAAGRPAAEGGFVAAVAAALPLADLWTMPVLVAVSGGADSVALLHALRRLVPAGMERRLIVAHAEHDLRPDADTDRRFVADLAARLGIAFVWRGISVGGAGGGEGVEGRARRLRYGFLAEAAHDHGARHVLVGHTADDQAETILQRMLRGSGLAGLGGMAAARELAPGVALVRPLLGLRRDAARGFLEAIGQAWREDPTNADVRHARNFVRHELLGRGVAGPFPAAAQSLARLGRQAALVAGALRSAAEHLLEAHSIRHADGRVVVRTRDLAGLDRHLLAEVFVALWCREGWPRRDMTARHYAVVAAAAVASATGGRHPGATDLPGGIRMTPLSPGLLSLEPPGGRTASG